MRLRILGLHGSQQNSVSLQNLIGKRILNRISHRAVLTFANAPHVLDVTELVYTACGPEPVYNWYDRLVDGSLVWNTIEASLSQLEAQWKSDGFNGIFAFSQGGVMAAIMAALPDRFPGLEFIICVGCPYVRQVYGGSNNPLNITEYDIPDSVRSIHFFGREDTEVITSSSMRLASMFIDPHFVEHDDGHCIPTSHHYANILINFIQSMHEQIFHAHYEELSHLVDSRLNDDSVEHGKNSKEQHKEKQQQRLLRRNRSNSDTRVVVPDLVIRGGRTLMVNEHTHLSSIAEGDIAAAVPEHIMLKQQMIYRHKQHAIHRRRRYSVHHV